MGSDDVSECQPHNHESFCEQMMRAPGAAGAIPSDGVNSCFGTLQSPRIPSVLNRTAKIITVGP